MRAGLVLVITVSVLLALGVACGDDGDGARAIPSPAGGSEGEAEEWEEADQSGVGEEVQGDEEGVDEEEAEGGDEEEGEGMGEACINEDHDGVCDEDDLCLDTPAESVVDDVGCSDAQVDQDNDGVCDPAAASDGPGDCDLIDDNCPLTPNPAQDDFDGDLEGDACDDDDDDDGFSDADESHYGSKVFDDASVPETEDVNPGSCIDGVDNDGNHLTDGDDGKCR